MLSNFHKKEAPIQGFAGFGGGITRLGLSGGGLVSFIRTSTRYQDQGDTPLITVDSESNVYFAYDVDPTDQSAQSVVEKIDAKGNVVWQKKFWGNFTQSPGSSSDRASFQGMALNVDESYLALNGYWVYSSSSFNTGNIVLLLDPSNGDILECVCPQRGGFHRAIGWHYSNTDRVYTFTSSQSQAVGWNIWITGPNKSSTPAINFGRTDSYRSDAMDLRDFFYKGSGTTFALNGRLKISSSSNKYPHTTTWGFNGGIQGEYYWNQWDYGSYISPVRWDSYEWLICQTNPNGGTSDAVLVTTPYAGVWRRQSTDIKYPVARYDPIGDSIWLVGEVSYQKYILLELDRSDGSVIQSCQFRFRIQSNTATWNNSYQPPLQNLLCITSDHVVFTANPAYSSYKSCMVLKLPKDLSTITNGTYTIEQIYDTEVVFETPSSFSWSSTTPSALTQNTSYTSSTSYNATFTDWSSLPNSTNPIVTNQTVSNTVSGTLTL